MSNIPPIATITTAATAIGNLILVTPQSTVGYQPQDVPQSPSQTLPNYSQPSLLFHYEGENTSTFSSDITDHFVEDNTAVQDQIALKPILITTQGFIGELNDIPPNKIFAAAYTAANKLTGVSAYAPALSITALLAYNEALFAYTTAANTVNSAVSAFNSLTGNASSGTSVITSGGITIQPNQTKQQQYYQQFFQYWNTRTLFTVQTPWAIFTNMAIQSCRAIQANDTTVISDFEITFKQIRFAVNLTAAALYSNNANMNGPLNAQAAPVVQNGTNALTTSTNTFSSSLASSIGQ